MKYFASTSLFAALLAVALSAFGQSQPHRDVSYERHPNLAQAQHLADEAYRSVRAAQQANEYDLGGHARKAEQLIDEANRELKLAAEYANSHGH